MKDNLDWKVAPDKDEMKTILAVQSAINAIEENNMDRDKRMKGHISRMVLSICVYLSFVASIWIFVLDPSKWYAMVIFLLLTLILSAP